MPEFIGSFLGVAVGAVITAAVSAYYYSLATTDLKKESKNLRQLSGMILKLLEEGTDHLSVNYNDRGEPVGLNLSIECEPAKFAMKAHPSSITLGDQSS